MKDENLHLSVAKRVSIQKGIVLILEGGSSRFSSRVHDLSSHREKARIAANTRQEFLLTTQALIPIRLFLLTPKTYVPLLQPCGYLSCWSLL